MKRKLKAAPIYIKKVWQPNSRSYSKWTQLHHTVWEGCCDCGLVHQIQYRALVSPDTKKVKLFSRCRQAGGHTARRRKHRYYPLWSKK